MTADDDRAYMAEVLEWALRYAERGFHVFPCHGIQTDGSCTCHDPACEAIGKHPRTTNGFKNSTTDKAQIEKWFGPKAKLSNVAIRTGKVSGCSVVDIDCGPEKIGGQSWTELTREKGEPKTLLATTGGGGFHMFYQYEPKMGKSCSNYLGDHYKHVDLRADGGYAIATPSRHKSGNSYAWDDWGVELAGVPPHLIPSQKEKKPNPGAQQPHPLEPEFTLDEVKDMLKAIPSDDRDTWLKVGIILGRTFPDNDEAYAAYHEWADTWGGKKGPKHDQRMHEYFYVLSKRESESQLTIGTLLKWARDNGWVPKAVLEMNKQYGVVWMGGDCVILREHIAPDTGLLDISFCTKSALKLFHATDPKIGRANKVEYWLGHPERRSYQGLVFQPGHTACDPSLYNLWRGFAVEPMKGDCSLYLEHLWENIVCGNQTLYRYVLAWMANIVQNPGNRPGVALVLRGLQGTGKGVFAKGFGCLFAPHFAHITHSHQLVGRFNALLKKAVVVFADEAFWAGDKQAEGTLNALITEETHNIEPKGIDPFSVRNFMHLIVASNHDWVVPAASEARRWLMLDVSEAHLQDHAYFKAIDTQMKNGGREALLYELLNYDGSGVDLWTVPKTAGLGDQIVHSMKPVEKFWFNCLKVGSQIGERTIKHEAAYYPDRGWETSLRAAELYDSYVRRSQQAGVPRRAMEMELADALKKMVPGASHGRIYANGVQDRGWQFPPLQECRTAFDLYMKWTYKWEKDEAPKEATVIQLELFDRRLYRRETDLVVLGADVVSLKSGA